MTKTKGKLRELNVFLLINSVGCGVPANPQGSNTGVHAKSFLPTNLRPSSLRSRGRTRRTHNTKRHEIYTGLGHRCGVIPYSSVVVDGLPLVRMMNSTREEQPPEFEVFLCLVS